MSRITANDRVRRLLSIVPWIAEQDGPLIADVCARFGIDRKDLLADLDVVFMVGLYPFTPDELIEVVLDDDRVWIRYAEFFRRPLRLTTEQGLALVAAGSSILAVPGAERDGPLARGLAKLAGAVGGAEASVVEIELGSVAEAVLHDLSTAVREHRAVLIDYYAYGRDERRERIIEPHRVYADEGAWYVSAYCRAAEGDRVFRLDRIQGHEVLDETFEQRAEPPELGVFRAHEDDPRVVLDLTAGGSWVAEQYPVESVEELDDGGVRVTLAISAVPWLERLLLRLGPHATVTDGPDDLAGVGTAAAARVLARYTD